MKILVTGFEPFGGAAVNTAWEAVRTLPHTVNGAAVITRQIPTSYASAAPAVLNAVREEMPDAIVLAGQAAGSAELRIERVAINLADAESADNDGVVKCDEAIVSGAQAAHFATLPARTLLRAVRDADVPVRLSYSAGAYVCNALYFAVLDGVDVPCVFIHVPICCENGGTMELKLIQRGLTAALEEIAKGANQ